MKRSPPINLPLRITDMSTKAKTSPTGAQMNILKNNTPKRGNAPRVLVFSGYGLNCEEETKFAFEYAGGEVDIVHINDLIARPKMLESYQIMAFPGGFSFGDDTGSGKAYANKFKNHLKKELEEFLNRDTLAIGICNGFQIMTNLGILPGALFYNKNARYIDRWVDLKVDGKSPWLAGIKKISLPIAHGEGRYITNKEEYKNLQKNKQIAFTYTKGEICNFQNLEKNPNGADYDIAGVLNAQTCPKCGCAPRFQTRWPWKEPQ